MKWYYFLLAFIIGTGLSFALGVKGIAQSMLGETAHYLPDETLIEYKLRAEEGDAEAAYALSCYYLKQGAAHYRAGHAWAMKAAQDGSAAGMMNAGICYYDGLGLEKDSTTAAKFFQASLEAGNTRVLNALAYMYATGEGVPRNPDKAFEYARRAADIGLPYALQTLGFMHANGIGTPVDTQKARALYQKEIDSNPDDGIACHSLAVLISQESDDHWSETVPLFQKAADRGCTLAYQPLAHAYWRGKGVKKDMALAAEYMQKAVESGDSDAYAYMAEMYHYGEGVPANMQMAEAWYRKAIDSNPEDSYSLYSLAAVIMAQSAGTEHAVEVEKLMTKSAELGNLAAMKYLVHEYAVDEGLLPGNKAAYARWCCAAADKNASWAFLPAVSLYENACAIDHDETKALRYCELAVQHNVYGAVASLAAMYATGKFVSQDIDKAVQLFRQSIRQFPDFSPAYTQLAQCLLHRDSAPATLKEAFYLLLEGAQRGDSAACRLLAVAYADGWAFDGDTQLPPDKEKAREYNVRAEAVISSGTSE